MVPPRVAAGNHGAAVVLPGPLEAVAWLIACTTCAGVITPWVTEAQLLPAVSSAGVWKLTPAFVIISADSCPVASGSGKLGNPCDRRHRAKAISAWVFARRWAGLSPEPFPGLPMMC